MKQDVDHKIIDAARTLFYAKGYMGTTMRDIAKTAEVNLALLHYYFRTKDNIFQIVFEEAFTLLFSKLIRALLSDRDIFEKIELMVESYVAMALKYPQLPSFIMNELAVNTEIMLSIINNHKDKSILNKSFDLFYQQVEMAMTDKVIKKIEPKSICTDIQALALYPFIAKNCLLHSVFNDEETYNKMLNDRSKHVSNCIINNIKL